MVKEQIVEIEPIDVRIDQIRADHMDKNVILKCAVHEVSVVRPRIEVAAFECARCGNIIHLPQPSYGEEFLEPAKCSCDDDRKGFLRLVQRESTFQDYQEAMVYDTNKKHQLKIIMRNKLVGTLNPGDRAAIGGILKSVPTRRKGSVFYTYYLDAITVTKDES